MNVFSCEHHISNCESFYNSTVYYWARDSCKGDRKMCIFSEKSKPSCICSLCFTGDHCEEEVSKNLWILSMPFDILTEKGIPINSIIMIVFGVLLVSNRILCLQTYLCRKIRQTNLGIYLIMLSIVSIFIGSLHIIWHLLILHFKELLYSDLFRASLCLYQKHIYIPLVSMYNWFIASVAIERVLVECFRNYGLHDSRCRSVIFSALVIIICPLSTLPGVFTVRENRLSIIAPDLCSNFTCFGFILYETITRIHLFAFYFIYIAMNIVVLGKLIRRRKHFVDNDSLLDQIGLILKKHKDFLIPYLIQALGQLSSVVMDFIMTCSAAGTILVAHLNLVFSILSILPFAMTFYLYIYLSPVYWSIFWNSSPVGKCLINIKQKLQTFPKHGTIYDSVPLETYT